MGKERQCVDDCDVIYIYILKETLKKMLQILTKSLCRKSLGLKGLWITKVGH